MKKTALSLFLIIVTFFTMLVPVQAYKTQNMYVNGGFEESLNHGWYVEREADYERVKDNPHSGEYCSRNVKDYAGERYCQDFVLVPGESYDLSFWARTEKGHGQAMVGVTVRYGHQISDVWDPATGISNVVFGDFYPTYGEEWTEIKTSFTYTGYDQYGKKLTAHNVQISITPNPNIWTEPPLVSYFDDFSLISRGNIKEANNDFMPEEYNWEEDPIAPKKESKDVNFADIENSWAEKTIEILAREGIVSGLDELTYAPEKNITRAEFITLVMNILNVKRDIKRAGYDDVSDDAWYANPIATAKKFGLIPEKLIENNNFYPDKPLTRGEVSGIIALYTDIIGATAGEDSKIFVDETNFGKWAEEIKKAASFGLINGYPDGTFCAERNITRAEVATIVVNMLELKGRRYFYVDPVNGDDENNDGTIQAPYKSIYKAQEAVRDNNSDMHGNVYVFLKAGNHYMNKTLNLTSADSGTNGYNIVYTSYGDGKAFLNGGETKKYNWEIYDSKKNIYRAYVGALNTRQMYVDGIRAIRARSEEKLEHYTVDLGQEYQAITKSMWLAEISDITDVEIVHTGIDFTPIHEEEGENYWTECESGNDFIICKTKNSGQSIYSKFAINQEYDNIIKTEKKLVQECDLKLSGELIFEKVVYNYVEREQGKDISLADADKYLEKSYEEYRKEHICRWAEIWEHSDIEIFGDDENQQGIRFCIFNMHQTYHGDDGRLNVGAKGLTGEKYSGWTFWDSETYCLPFYMFNNPKAAKNLLMYRYNTLKQAKERAVEQGCEGACYPMVTIDGTESCGVWQHGNLEIHVTAAVAYGVWHYVRNTDDEEFLKRYGLELLVETSRYFASRGGWSPKTGEFGLYGVMGPDEFHMMVHNNTYTNYMVKKNFYYTIEMVKKYGYNISSTELDLWLKMADNMRINYDDKTKLYEQHDGYFDLPEYDVKTMDPNKVPVYKYWAYDSIFRINMLKQPDVVLMQFFYSNDFTEEEKKVNFEYYEKRCSHESSLSPAVHSIMAAEIGDMKMAEEYMAYGSRIDIDDYNRNTHQGLHVTSMAAAWMNIVYGFGGMRSDGDVLSFSPKIPEAWGEYSFKILVKGCTLKVKVNKNTSIFVLESGSALKLKIYDREYDVTKSGIEINLTY